MLMDKYNLITILGPTATGKTSVAVGLAREIGGEIISADSRQVYRGMDLGTGKDLVDYECGGEKVSCHLIDIVDAGYKYNLFEYKRDFEKAFNEVSERERVPILCGGTGLYVESVLKGYNLVEVPVNEDLRRELEGRNLEELVDVLKSVPNYAMHNSTDVDTVKRAVRAIEIAKYYYENGIERVERSENMLQINPIIFGIDISRELRRERISKRLKVRLDEGMIDEVRGLLDGGIAPEDLIYYGLEYKFVTQYLIGELGYDEMYNGLEIAIHQFAKRQMTWFRGMERRGFVINWIDGEKNVEERVDEILKFLR